MLLPVLTKKRKSAKEVPPAAGNIYDAFCDFLFFLPFTPTQARRQEVQAHRLTKKLVSDLQK
jgi:hypothetical protein